MLRESKMHIRRLGHPENAPGARFGPGALSLFNHCYQLDNQAYLIFLASRCHIFQIGVWKGHTGSLPISRFARICDLRHFRRNQVDD